MFIQKKTQSQSLVAADIHRISKSKNQNQLLSPICKTLIFCYVFYSPISLEASHFFEDLVTEICISNPNDVRKKKSHPQNKNLRRYYSLTLSQNKKYLRKKECI